MSLLKEMSVYQVKALLIHRLKSRGTAGHGVHSPYIYDFLTKVIRNKTDDNIVKRVESLRREMYTDERIISVTDLGAGSLKNNNRERRVSDIARWSALPAKEVDLLARISGSVEQRAWSRERAGEAERERKGQGAEGTGYGAHEAKQRVIPRSGRAGSREVGRGDEEGIILELGTSLGISTLALALAAPGRKIITVEGCPELSEIAAANLRRYGAENAEVINMEFSKSLEVLKQKGEKVVFAFIDGNHRGEALKQYVEAISSMGSELMIVADDIHLSPDMYRGWENIVERGLFEASMETKRFGILFKKKSLTPGRYRIWC